MFYNDPMLYGATLPYKDVNFQMPFMPQYALWQNLQRFIPQNYPGYNYGYQEVPKVPYPQFPGFQNFPLQQLPFPQFPIQQLPIQQFPQQFPLQQIPFQQLPFPAWTPYQAWTPFPPNYGMNMPFHGFQRPFVG